MIRFLDGPAAGLVLELKRAPPLLRVVRDPAGAFDALDQLDDAPRPDESVTVYRRVGRPGSVHVDYCRPRRGVWYLTAAYEVCPDQPGDADARDTTRWREWARRQQQREKVQRETDTG